MKSLSFLCLSLMLVVFQMVMAEPTASSVQTRTTSTIEQLEKKRRHFEKIGGLNEDEKYRFLDQMGISEAVFNHLETCLNIDWKTAGMHQLEKSHSTLSLPEGYLLSTHDEMIKYGHLIGNLDDDDLEAISTDIEFDDVFYFRHYNDGYISIDDWSELDPNELLASIIEGTEEANKE